jgi:hypothetical protein
MGVRGLLFPAGCGHELRPAWEPVTVRRAAAASPRRSQGWPVSPYRRRNPREQASWAGARSVRQSMVVARTASSIPAYPWVSCASGAFPCLRHRRGCGLRCGGCRWLRVLSGQAVLVADSVKDVLGRLPGASRVVLFGCRRGSAASPTRATGQRRASPANLGNMPARDGRAAPDSVRPHQ